MIKPGDTVTWTSQASGSTKTKTGKVMAIVPAEANVMKLIPGSAKRSHIKIDMPKSIYNRVLIAVPTGKEGKITHYYAPKLSAFDSSN